MKLKLEPGKYVIAVSGGVDSMVLLDVLAQTPEVKLTVAHFDHGIRQDSAEDRKLVQARAKQLKLPFVYEEGKLGPGASEAAARQARYGFLHKTRRASGARAVITAHHQDDLIETMVLNLLRGTGRRGLSSLKSTDIVKRPMLDITKRQIRAYALAHKTQWREDSTNADPSYRRNYVRQNLMSKLSIAQRQRLAEIARSAELSNHHLDILLVNYLHSQPKAGQLDRASFVRLHEKIAREVMASWLRASGIRGYDKKTIDRLVAAGKEGRIGSKVDIMSGNWLKVNKNNLALQLAER